MSIIGMATVCLHTRRIASCVMICVTILFLQGTASAHMRHGYREFYARYKHHEYRHRYHPEPMKIDPTKFEEIKCAAMNAYFESDKGVDEMFVSQFMIAYVTLQRANKGRIELSFEKLFGGKTLCTVTYARVQFSWTIARVCRWCQKWIRLQDAPQGYKWESAQYAAQVVNEGWRPQDISLNPELNRATYYFNPSPKLVSKRMACLFRQSYIRLAQGEIVGGHEFYDLPRNDEERQRLIDAHKDPDHACDPVDTKIP